MATIWDDLIAADNLAQQHGAGGMHPRLRKAIEATAGFPPRSSGPLHKAEGRAPVDKVIWLFPAQPMRNRGQA